MTPDRCRPPCPDQATHHDNVRARLAAVARTNWGTP